MSDEQEKSQLVSTWGDVEQVIKQNAFPKWAGRILGIGFVLVLALSVIVGIGYVKLRSVVTAQKNVVAAQKAAAIASCMSGNEARGTNVLIWDSFITLLVSNPTTDKTRTDLISSVAALNLPASETQAFDLIITTNWTNSPDNLKLAAQFKAYIAAHEPQVNCQKLYAN